MKQARAPKYAAPKKATRSASPPKKTVSRFENITKSEWGGRDHDQFEITEMLELCPLSDGKTFELRSVYFRREDCMLIRNPRPLSDKTRLENLVCQNSAQTSILRNLKIPLYLYDVHLVKNCFQMTVINVNSRAEDFMDLVFLPVEEEEEEQHEAEFPQFSPLFADAYQQPAPQRPHVPQNIPMMPTAEQQPQPMGFFFAEIPPYAAPAPASTSTMEEVFDEAPKEPQGTTLGQPPKQHKKKPSSKPRDAAASSTAEQID